MHLRYNTVLPIDNTTVFSSLAAEFIPIFHHHRSHQQQSLLQQHILDLILQKRIRIFINHASKQEACCCRDRLHWWRRQLPVDRHEKDRTLAICLGAIVHHENRL